MSLDETTVTFISLLSNLLKKIFFKNVKKISLFLFVSFLLWFVYSFFVPLKYSFSSRNVVGTFMIPDGFTSNQVIQKLKKNHWIKKTFPYGWFFRFSTFKAGEYSFSPNMNPYKVLNQIIKGDVMTYFVVIPEGMNMFEIATIFDKKNLVLRDEFLKWSQDPKFIKKLLGENLESLEGYLYPNTYKVSRGLKAATLIKMMVQEFLKNYSSLSKPKDFFLTRHEVVILASIVEKETGAVFERPKIASVFHNRLKKGMRLESDPTILYGILRQTGQMPLNIRKKDILKKTPYNTYKIKRLPKGPIANPGSAALQAVLNPEKTPYYFFVSRNDGTHVFSKTYKEHKKAVYIYQQKPFIKK